MSTYPVISVLMPAYNSSSTITRAVDSILTQTFTDFELIILDDYSTDQTAAIVRDYIKQDKRIRLVQNSTNQGIATNRNLAVAESRGKYIAFIDSDDYVDPKYLETLYKNLQESKSDITACSYVEEYQNASIAPPIQAKRITTYSSAEAIHEYLRYGDLGAFTTCKLIKKSLFDGVAFPDGRIFEDLAVCYQLFAKAKQVTFIPQHLYHYVQKSTSAVHKRQSLRDLEFLFAIPDQVENYLDGQPDKSDLVYFRFRTYLSVINLTLSSHTPAPSLTRKIIKYFRTHFLSIKHSGLSKREHIQLATLRLGLAPYRLLHFIQRALFRKHTV